jgi:hypothetical protein
MKTSDLHHTNKSKFLPGELLRVLRTPTAQNGVELLPIQSRELQRGPQIKRGDILLYVGLRHTKWSKQHIVLCHGYLGEIYVDSVLLTRELH